ncbi:MAG: 3-oxoacyl-ACP reductase FabG [Arenicellales bacterium]|jgi:3-oxoacyl-[acyl-carrier protein] reductase
MTSLGNEICLVTGASRGIGRAIAATLGRAGAVVVGTATTDEGAAAISACLEEQGLRGKGLKLDVTSSEQVNELIAAVTDELGAPTVAVNNAGITRDNLLLRMKEEEWDAVLDADLKAVYRVSKACLRRMTKARHGRIINITSVVGVSGNPGQTNYSAAKAGIIGFTRSLAREVGNRGVTVNAVAPGFIDTDMTRVLSEAQREALLETIPLGRLGDPDDVAQAVLYLASPAGAYVTGTTLHVNGGMYMG